MTETKIIRPNPGGQEAFVRSNVDVCIYGGILAGGKLTPLTSCVLTPYGWRLNKDLKIGDKICTPFNGVQKVAGLFPQGVKKIYKVYLLDGRVAECGLEHLWTYRTNKQRYKYIVSDRSNPTAWTFTGTTENIIERLKRGERIYLPTNNAIEFEEKDLPINPYALGVLIGDGCLTDKVMTEGRNAITISNNEDDVINRFYNAVGGTRIYKQPNCYSKSVFTPRAKQIRQYLVDAGLNTYSYNKFIPHEYLFSSIEQRRELLAGLFDTDGSVDEGSFSYCTTSKRLKDDIMHLARSLGYNASVHRDEREQYTTGEAFRVIIRTSDEIFHSEKHKKRYAEYLTRKGKNYRKANCHTRIVKIEYDRDEEAQCLYIDDRDHLYMTDDFVVTHNTFGSILCAAQPALDPLFRATYFRRTLGQLKQSGGIVDDFQAAYGKEINVKISENPRVTFSSGAYAEMQQINDESPKRVIEAYKGLQSDCIFFDELTNFEFFTFFYLMSRARGKGKWTGKIRATTNPSKRHWLRKFLDWYISPDGTIPPERSGVVRYFYIKGDKVTDVVWGDSKEEVYDKCKIDINRKLSTMKGEFSYKNLIKSFTFILGNLSENKALLEGNKDYIGNIAATGGRMSQALIEGNWNVDIDGDDLSPIKADAAMDVFVNDPCMNNDKWITVDLANEGRDNTVILVWNGFHVIDVDIIVTGTPKGNAERVKIMAQKHNIADEHIIYDAIGSGVGFGDWIPDAIPFCSYNVPMGAYSRSAFNLKDECYLRLVHMINNRRISISESVANAKYIHKGISQDILFRNEFEEECAVVRFKDLPSGKKRLFNKKEMNAMLGKGRSMDVLDPFAMRMYPVLGALYGDEMLYGLSEEEDDEIKEERGDIYEDNFWA